MVRHEHGSSQAKTATKQYASMARNTRKSHPFIPAWGRIIPFIEKKRGGGGSTIGKFMKQKNLNQLCWLTTHEDNKKNKAQVSHFCSPASHSSVRKTKEFSMKKGKNNNKRKYFMKLRSPKPVLFVECRLTDQISIFIENSSRKSFFGTEGKPVHVIIQCHWPLFLKKKINAHICQDYHHSVIQPLCIYLWFFFFEELNVFSYSPPPPTFSFATVPWWLNQWTRSSYILPC